MVMSFIYISQQCVIYLGIIMIIVGVIGNTINILVFTSVRNYRTTPSTFYYLIGSIQEVIVLLVNVGMRVAFEGFVLELGRTSPALCKIRRYLYGVLSAIPLCYACLATMDQFFITSSNIRIRNLSSIKWAHRIVIIVIIICSLYGIPYILFADLSPATRMCIYVDTVFAVYVPLFVVLVLCITVSFILIIFGYLAYRNIQRSTALTGQGAQKQMTRMICMQVVWIVFCLAPNGIYYVYVWSRFGIMHTADPNSVEYVIFIFFNLLTWATYAVCFICCIKIVHFLLWFLG